MQPAIRPAQMQRESNEMNTAKSAPAELEDDDATTTYGTGTGGGVEFIQHFMTCNEGPLSDGPFCMLVTLFHVTMEIFLERTAL